MCQFCEMSDEVLIALLPTLDDDHDLDLARNSLWRRSGSSLALKLLDRQARLEGRDHA